MRSMNETQKRVWTHAGSSGRAVLCVLAGLLLGASHGFAQASATSASALSSPPSLASTSSSSTPSSSEPRALQIESIEVEGNTRTASHRIVTASGLQVGDAARPEDLIEAARRLEESILVRKAEVHTRVGSQPGRVVVVFSVQENSLQLRFGVGQEDLSGWYLIPIQLRMDNLTGRGETLDLSFWTGYEVGGLVLRYRLEDLVEPARYHAARLQVLGHQRIYYQDELEVSHQVGRYGAEFQAGRPLNSIFRLEGWLAPEYIDPDSSGMVINDPDSDQYETTDDVPFADLHPDIQRDLGNRWQGRGGLALVLDNRRGRGMQTRGFRGRVLGEAVVSEREDLVRLEWDLRTYRPLARGIMVAARTRLGGVSAGAPFFENYYLGGLYSVRGYSTSGLSPTMGDRFMATAALELRGSWIGPPESPRLTGYLFADAGLGWRNKLDWGQGGAGVGYGMCFKVPWFGFLSLDVGVPLGSEISGNSFHGYLSIGTSF